MGKFDFIFCMNVLIYFSDERRSALIQRFYEYLEPGGYLFLGPRSSEIPLKYGELVQVLLAARASPTVSVRNVRVDHGDIRGEIVTSDPLSDGKEGRPEGR